jgi:hypothetical protein
MTKHMRKLSGVLALIAGMALCFPQAAGAATASKRGTASFSPTTTTPVVLIPALVIHPPVVQVAARPTAADPPPRSAGAVLPLTGAGHLVVASMTGLFLIGLGLLLRRGAAA